MTKALTKFAVLIPIILSLTPKISSGFLDPGCKGEIGFWNKFSCEHFLLVFITNIIILLVIFAFVIYVIIFFIRKVARRETSFLNKKVFYLVFGITVLSGLLSGLIFFFYLILGI